ncbi:AAA family ATPase (plasmid) [Azospirillum melinis]|uniref:AAA family ATPase n=1 Tax=Azospirillum melinis TaxID=328839 RepID=UPI0037572691
MADKLDQTFTYASKLELHDIPDGPDAPDDRTGLVYVHDRALKLAVEVALTAGRPLLLRGKPGTGKSSLAAYIARNLNWRYYEHVVTAATEARDLLWGLDAVGRLADAQIPRTDGTALGQHEYIEPGVLWWALDPDSAILRGTDDRSKIERQALDPFASVNRRRDPDRAVVLIDEIDKADPDVPNGLLVPLGSLEFHVTPIQKTVGIDHKPPARDPWPLTKALVIITTNEERDLPDAFLRRCVVHEIQEPTDEQLIKIAQAHFRHVDKPQDAPLFKEIAGKLVELRKEASRKGVKPPSTAEYLDAIRAVRGLGLTIDSPEWKHVERLVLRKHRTLSDAES